MSDNDFRITEDFDGDQTFYNLLENEKVIYSGYVMEDILDYLYDLKELRGKKWVSVQYVKKKYTLY